MCFSDAFLESAKSSRGGNGRSDLRKSTAPNFSAPVRGLKQTLGLEVLLGDVIESIGGWPRSSHLG